ncbi:Flp pilus assembly protein CpaB [Pseudarthrobacter sp. NamB4]|uniref:Flp pilus assembly protein CpaB n=1 Tax=Pseudarthrobacter sp. NamB4 TaxID=2576837 RepID=UPI0010FD0C01|nr:RcpC/CpaB family pilus assembly protein [Pseudarthrobacter sp. NamB4]TLM74707.1 flagellar biosynthesis protein FlgA [Pseudarthrobacter sp. NamB4]
MKSRLLAGAAAAVLAIAGVFLIVNYAQGADQRAVKNLEPKAVLVVKAAVPAGTPVESMAASVVTEQLPASAISDSALTTLDGSAGKVAAVDLLPGEQLVAERLVAPAELKTQGSVEVPAGLQEVSFQLEPDRVVGGRLAPGDHVGVFVSMDEGAIAARADKETTKLTVRKALVTAVQRAPVATPAPSASADPSAADPQDTTLPTGSLMLTVAVNDVDAAKIVFAAEYAKMWLSKEPTDATDSGPRIIERTEVYK